MTPCAKPDIYNDASGKHCRRENRGNLRVRRGVRRERMFGAVTVRVRVARDSPDQAIFVAELARHTLVPHFSVSNMSGDNPRTNHNYACGL